MSFWVYFIIWCLAITAICAAVSILLEMAGKLIGSDAVMRIGAASFGAALTVFMVMMVASCITPNFH